MLKEIFSNLNRRKVKVFIVFLACSFVIWLISKLSEPYESRVTFNMNYSDLPDTLLLTKEASNTVTAKLKANGFQFLYYNLNLKGITLDLSTVQENGSKYFVDARQLKKGLEAQLAKSTSLIEVEHDLIYIDLYKVAAKKVPVRPSVSLQLSQNYFLEGPLQIEPDTVILKGPRIEIDGVTEISTVDLELKELSSNFSQELRLSMPKQIQNSELSHTKVRIAGKVVRFSEKVFDIPIKVVNLPEEFDIKIFPNTVAVVCKAAVDRLRNLTVDDFEVIADYENARASSHMLLKLDKKPENVYDVKLQENQVQFILEKTK